MLAGRTLLNGKVVYGKFIYDNRELTCTPFEFYKVDAFIGLFCISYRSRQKLVPMSMPTRGVVKMNTSVNDINSSSSKMVSMSCKSCQC